MLPELIGHRGARSLFPENTIEGFRAALAAGVSRFEVDVALTRDGVPVLSHDPCLSPDLTRDPSGRWIRFGPAIHQLILSKYHKPWGCTRQKLKKHE